MAAPSRWTRGQPISARRLNQMVEAAADRGASIARSAAQLDGSRLEEMRILSVHDNHVIARPAWGTGAAGLVVALPWDLRRSTYDGQTLNGVSYTHTSSGLRSATQGATNETQRITPDYYSGGVVLALFQPRAAARVDVSSNNSGLFRAAQWLDINASGRVWAVSTP